MRMRTTYRVRAPWRPAALVAVATVAATMLAACATTAAGDPTSAPASSAAAPSAAAPSAAAPSAGGVVRLLAHDSFAVSEDGKTISGAPARPLAAGAYVVNWRVASPDGHRMTGSTNFSVR